MRGRDPQRPGRAGPALRQRVRSGVGRIRRALPPASIQRGVARLRAMLARRGVQRGTERAGPVLPKRAASERTVLNPPSPGNIAGHVGPTVLRLLILLVFGVLFWQRLGHSAGLWSALLSLILLHLGVVGLVLLKGVSVTVLRDGLLIEPWLAGPLRPRRRDRVWWNEVKRVEYRTHRGIRAAEWRLDLHKIRGQFVLSSRWFDTADLDRLKALLVAEVGPERVSGP